MQLPSNLKISRPPAPKDAVPVKKRGKKKFIIAGAAVVIAVAAVFHMTVGAANTNQPALSASDVMTLRRTDLQNTISATGTVESASSVMVYSTMSYAVQEVYVEVGDYVEAGQLMAKLDGDNILKQIESQEASMDAAQNASSASIASAQHNYEQYKSTLDAGLNSSLLNAETSVTNARNNYTTAVNTYERYKADLDAGTNSAIQAAQDRVDSAYDAYVSAMNTYDRFKADLENGTNSSILGAQNSLTSAHTNYIAAVNTYERYKAGLDAGENTTMLNQDASLRSMETAMVNAENSYYDALDAVDDAEDAVSDAERSLSNARSDADSARQELDRIYDTISRLQAQIDAAEEGADTAGLYAKLTEYQNSIPAAEQKAAQYDTIVFNAETALKQAENALDSTKKQVSTLERTWNDAKASYETANAQYRATETSVDNALQDYYTNVTTAWDAYLSAQTSLESAQTNAQNMLSDYADALQNAYETYETAIRDCDTAKTDAQETLSDYADTMDTAKESYDSAQTNLQSTQVSVKNQLQSYKDSLNNAYAGADQSVSEVSLRQLRANLASTDITAPSAGTVTAVYAEVGSSGSGLLFVIEDVEQLVAATSVKDYDVGRLSKGMAVTIKSDSTGDNVYNGQVASIAPTATKNAMGETDTTGDVAFATDVDVTSQDTGLKIGMSVRLNFILDEAKNALTVPYDAVYENSVGQTCLLAAEEQEDGTYLLQEYSVETGLENDLDVEVKGNGLAEGMHIISEPSKYLAFAGKYLALTGQTAPARTEGGF